MGRKSSSNVAVFVRLFLIVAMAMVCVLTFCSCDTKDVESLFQPSDFTVTFVLNNGEENVIWRKGDAVPTPQKKDFEFLYWCSDADLTAKTNLDFEKLNLVNSITVYAKWKELDDIQGVVFNDFSCVYDTKPHSIIVENLPEGAVVSYDVQNVQVAAGVYPVTATIKKEGCKDLVLSATLTINKAKVENILFPPVAVDWDGQAYGAFIKGELPEEVSVSYTGNGQSEVGEYDIVAKFTVSDNYEPIADMTTKLVINEVYFFVTFDDGVSTPIVRKVAHGKAVADMPLPTAKVGYSAKWEKESVENVLENLTVHAIYTPVVYTVSFVSDGETVSEKTYDIESSLTFEDISKPHYTFGGWFDNQNCFGNATKSINVGNTGDKTYYAKWVAVEYYVTYHLNGGNNSELNTNDNGKYKYTIESDEFEFKAPSRKNYTFDGWYADADFEGESVSALKKGAHGNFDLYAKWIVEKFAITYELGGGVNDQNNPTYTSAEGEEIALLPATREHYEFTCWKNKQNQTVQKIEKGRAEEIYLIAEWKAKEYSIEYELGGGVNADNKNSYTVEDDDFVLIAPSRNGYAFDGWYFEEDYSGNKVEKIDCSLGKNLKVYAKWSVVGYAIEYDVNGGENVQNPTEYTVESNDILLNAPTRVGYEFEGWFDKANNVVEQIEKGSVGNISLKAKWRAIKYVISFDSGCEIGVASAEYTVESEDITIEELKRNHYIFGGWFDEDGKKISVVASGSTGNIALTAKWSAIEYKITFDANGGSNVQDIIYTVETASFDLPTSSKANYEFAGWYDGEEQILHIEKGSFGNLSLVARWSAVGYKVKFESNGGSEIQDKNYNADMPNFDLPVPTREYYDFAGWYANSDLSGDRVVDFSTDKDVTLYAKWIAKEYTIKFYSNGGESVKSHIYSVESADFTLPSIRKEYYDFIGWFDENGKKYEVISSKNPQDTTLYAMWKATEYTIVYILDGGENAENPAIYTVESDEIVLNAPSKDGYTFDGWFVDESKIERIVKGSHGDLILTARWTENIVVPLSDFAVENGVVTAYNGSATSITIKATEGGEKVVSIAKNTFDDVRTTVMEIYIEEGIQSVEVGAFDGMTALQTLVLPSTITIMHKGMLQDCAALVNLTIPFTSFAVDNKEDTQARAFTDSNDGKYAYGIAYLFGTPDDSVRDKFGDYTPYYMNFESGNTVMDNNTICIPISLTNLTVLGGNIIKKCFASMLNLQSVIIKGQSSIGQQAFSKCSSLKEVGIENENSTFGSAVFADCSDMTIYVASDEQKSTLDGQISSLTNVTCTVA